MLKIVGGVMDSKVLAPEDVAKIATLPTLDEARAKIVAGIANTSSTINKYFACTWRKNC